MGSVGKGWADEWSGGQGVSISDTLTGRGSGGPTWSTTTVDRATASLAVHAGPPQLHATGCTSTSGGEKGTKAQQSGHAGSRATAAAALEERCRRKEERPSLTTL
jgi:hypothetical protein